MYVGILCRGRQNHATYHGVSCVGLCSDFTFRLALLAGLCLALERPRRGDQLVAMPENVNQRSPYTFEPIEFFWHCRELYVVHKLCRALPSTSIFELCITSTPNARRLLPHINPEALNSFSCCLMMSRLECYTLAYAHSSL